MLVLATLSNQLRALPFQTPSPHHNRLVQTVTTTVPVLVRATDYQPDTDGMPPAGKTGNLRLRLAEGFCRCSKSHPSGCGTAGRRKRKARNNNSKLLHCIRSSPVVATRLPARATRSTKRNSKEISRYNRKLEKRPACKTATAGSDLHLHPQHTDIKCVFTGRGDTPFPPIVA